MSSTQTEWEMGNTELHPALTGGDTEQNVELPTIASDVLSSPSEVKTETEEPADKEDNDAQSFEVNKALSAPNDEDPFTTTTSTETNLPPFTVPPPQSPQNLSESITHPAFSTANQYATWTIESLAQGITETKAKIAELQTQRDDEIDSLRLSIEQVKEKLRALGEDPDPEPRTPDRKRRRRMEESEGEDEDGTYGSQRKKGKKGRKGGRKKRVS